MNPEHWTHIPTAQLTINNMTVAQTSIEAISPQKRTGFSGHHISTGVMP